MICETTLGPTVEGSWPLSTPTAGLVDATVGVSGQELSVADTYLSETVMILYLLTFSIDMSTHDSGTEVPQSMRQRRILDVARENPTASVEQLASMVSSATPQLVEEVLERYGDPSADDELSAPSDTGTDSGAGPETDSVTDNDTQPEPEAADGNAQHDTDDMGNTDDTNDTNGTSATTYPDIEELSANQREVLEAIAATPGATQREIAERFDLSTATINNRVNSIPGFEWIDRESFVEQVLDEPPSPDVATTHTSTTTAATQPSADDESTATEPTHTTDASSDTDRGDAGTATSSSESSTAGESQRAAQSVEYQDLTESISALRADIQQLSGRLSALESDAVDESSAFEDAELVHKVAHACLTSDAISESEELRILEVLLE